MSSMTHSFARAPQAHIRRSSFDRSSGLKTTFDSDYLVPIFVDEALPGDTFNLKTNLFARMSTPIYPVMDNAYLDLFYFAVPVRLVWDNFVKMMGEQDNPNDSTDYRIPQKVLVSGASEGGIADHFGIPINVPGLSGSALPFRAYNLIWNEWFRDQNLQDSLDVPKGDGPDGPVAYTLKKRGKKHDYFTSALPWPQKGEAVHLPITGDIPVYGGYEVGGISDVFKNADGNIGFTPETGAVATGPLTDARYANTDGVADTETVLWPNMYADLDNNTQITINSLRQAMQVQAMYEKDARGGTRYTELMRSHFGVISPDARLQRPEYLGGGSSRINMNPLASTADTGTGTAPGGGRQLGGMSAIATTSQNGTGFVKSFTEHTIIIGLANVRTDITYQQGLNRMWSRRDKLDFYWPSLATIGEQEVKNKEIFAQGTDDDELVFGYQERFAEYRYKPSEIHGAFRSNYDGTLDSWHYAQNFSDLPTLSDTFIQQNSPVARTLAVQNEPEIIADFHHNLKCARPMPMFGIPFSMSRF